MGSVELHLGDCLEIMKALPDQSIHAIVTDPPAGISFMGKSWDKDKGGRDNWIAWMEQVARECLRLIKPGGHALVWAIPRTSHWTAMAWENAGWEVRDRIAFAFGSGFPKALDVGKAIDAMNGAEREVVTQSAHHCDGRKSAIWGAEERGRVITAPATDAAKQWDGWKSALKPAIEDWWLFRKPLDGTIAENVLKHGVGALNVEGCRVPSKETTGWGGGGSRMYEGGLSREGGEARLTDAGRYPSHLIHDGSEDVVRCFPETIQIDRRMFVIQRHPRNNGSGCVYGKDENLDPQPAYSDSGSASRFFQCCPFEDEDFEATRLFYAAKAGKSDRNEGCEETLVTRYDVPIGGRLCKDVVMELVTSLQKATSESTVKWLIGESGRSIMGLCQADFLSTTLMVISRITTSQILNSLTPSLISVFTQVASCEVESGGSHAENAESLSGPSSITTNESRVELVHGASHAVSKMLPLISDAENWKPLTNIHSTVKPLSLMRYLCKLITPPGGAVLDCFMGSGSTGKAALLEGFDFIGIEQDADYFEIAKKRIEHADRKVRGIVREPVPGGDVQAGLFGEE